MIQTGEAYILRTCKADMTSYGGFVWPRAGLVEAPDWNPKPKCGGGLHGFLWGEGDGTLANWSDDAVWLVARVNEWVDLGGKVKFPRAEVVLAGNRKDATDFIISKGARGAVIGASVVAGFRGQATAGYRGQATAGYGGQATAGDGGQATAGDGGQATAGHYGQAAAGDGGRAIAGKRGLATAGEHGQATAGHYGQATAGEYGQATAGEYGQATAGYRGQATAGYYGQAAAGDGGRAAAGEYGQATAGEYGQATAGEYGQATAGYRGILSVRWYDGRRYRIAVAYVGEDGIKPNTTYRVEGGKFVEVAK